MTVEQYQRAVFEDVVSLIVFAGLVVAVLSVARVVIWLLEKLGDDE